MSVSLRALQASDADAVAALARIEAVARRLGGTPFDGSESWAKRLAERDAQRSLALGAFEGDALRGFAMLDGLPNVRGRHVARISLAVHPEHHRRGIGDRLIRALVESAERWYGFLRIELGVQADNAPAIALYEKHGFVIETRCDKEMLVDGVLTPGLGMARIRPDFSPLPALGAPPPIPLAGPRRPVSLRPRNAGDATAFARLHETESVMEGTFQLPFQTAAQWTARFEHTPAGSHVLVAEVEGAFAGVVGLFPLSPSPRFRHVGVLGMSVDPRFQGCGVGHALMGGITDLADRWLGLSRVMLEVYEDNTRAQHLYARHGFVVEGTKRALALRRGTYVDALQMARVR